MLFYQPPPRAPERRSHHVSTTEIVVATPPAPYAIRIGAGLLAALGEELDAAGFPRRRILVSSPVVWRLFGDRVQASLPGVPVVLAPDGERHKNLKTVSRIYDALLRLGADRGTGIVAVGGGVLGDSAGFAAASFLRGLALAQVPTTLLAQVDSSVGGKVGVNHPLGKNLIGAFHQPVLVAADPLCLTTLPRREFRSGLYEVVKYGVIASRSLFDLLVRDTKAVLARTPSVLVPAIVESCRIKADVVSKDEREGGLRRILNFGHTIGHALEAITNYRRFRHGEAIAHGMLGAADLSAARGALSQDDRQAIASLIAKLGPLPAVQDLSIDEAMAAIRRDKKVVHGTLHFVLAISIGTTATVDDVSEAELRGALSRLGLR